MRIRLLLILQITIIICLISCKASKHLASSPAHRSSAFPRSDFNLTQQSYIDTYKDIAVSEMRRTGIPASITLAQGMIESDYGRSTLALDANNHFGIKCHNDWVGPKIYHNDDSRNECFRKYSRAEDSFYDHSQFLKSGSRYSFLFTLSPTDYKGWAQGLKKAGYATNPDYANMLIRKIEEERLQFYDDGYNPAASAGNSQAPVKESTAVRESQKNTGTTGQKAPVQSSPVNEKLMVAARPPRVFENNNLRYIVVKDGDTREKLEEEFQLLHWELPRYNELSSDFKLTAGQMLYLQPKKEKAATGNEFCTALEGDTMYLISQRFGIKLKTLCKMNRMQEDSAPEPGTKIWLRDIKPLN
jgi:LysM repeat protein